MHRGQEVHADYGSRCARDGLGSDARDVRVVARKTDLGAGGHQTAVEKGAARLTGGARVPVTSRECRAWGFGQAHALMGQAMGQRVKLGWPVEGVGPTENCFL
jgi:hypothetical protein